jgi:hypothetical protein
MSDVMQVLGAGVPLTLLVDLAYGSGPDSREILRREGVDPEWAALSLD